MTRSTEKLITTIGVIISVTGLIGSPTLLILALTTHTLMYGFTGIMWLTAWMLSIRWLDKHDPYGEEFHEQFLLNTAEDSDPNL